jgi:DNA polymerase-3 subunit alpha
VLDEEPLLKELYGNPENKEIIDNALKLEGCIRNTSIHAAAVVIGKDPLTLTTALQTSSKGENIITTQYSMKPIEELGLLKMDFLGLKNLSIIERCLDNIKETKGEVIDILHIPLDDPKPYEMLSEGAAIGVFQFESPGMRKYLKELKPTCIEDLIAMVSLYRPGPMEFISDFIDGKHGRKEIIYLHPCLEPILSETYGIAVYQEQIQRIAQDFAGYSLGEADLLRRAIGKKIKAELDAQREVFLRKSAEMGRDKDLAEKLFSFVEPFARYGFNKAHAASYAMISYQTAYLKANYPVEYMTSILTADSGNTEKIIKEIAECEQMGIEVVPPNVNSSCEDFTVSADGKAIYFGLAAIKNIGEGPAQAIMEVRGDTPFESISDFIKRLGSKFTTKKVLESLAKTGALDDLAERNQVLENIGTITAFVKGYEKTKHDSQIDLFAALGSDAPQELVLPEMIPATPDERLMWEKELIGVYVSSHPLEDISDYLKKYHANR